MQEYLKNIQWPTVIAAVVITFVLLIVLGRR